MESVTTNGTDIDKDIHNKLLVIKSDFWRTCLRTLGDEIQNEVISCIVCINLFVLILSNVFL
jgi:hypothetical protein